MRSEEKGLVFVALSRCRAVALSRCRAVALSRCRAVALSAVAAGLVSIADPRLQAQVAPLFVNIETGVDSNPGTQPLPVKHISRAIAIAANSPVSIFVAGRDDNITGNPIPYATSTGETLPLNMFPGLRIYREVDEPGGSENGAPVVISGANTTPILVQISSTSGQSFLSDTVLDGLVFESATQAAIQMTVSTSSAPMAGTMSPTLSNLTVNSNYVGVDVVAGPNVVNTSAIAQPTILNCDFVHTLLFDGSNPVTNPIAFIRETATNNVNLGAPPNAAGTIQGCRFLFDVNGAFAFLQGAHAIDLHAIKAKVNPTILGCTMYGGTYPLAPTAIEVGIYADAADQDCEASFTATNTTIYQMMLNGIEVYGKKYNLAPDPTRFSNVMIDTCSIYSNGLNATSDPTTGHGISIHVENEARIFATIQNCGNAGPINPSTGGYQDYQHRIRANTRDGIHLQAVGDLTPRKGTNSTPQQSTLINATISNNRISGEASSSSQLDQDGIEVVADLGTVITDIHQNQIFDNRRSGIRNWCHGAKSPLVSPSDFSSAQMKAYNNFIFASETTSMGISYIQGTGIWNERSVPLPGLAPYAHASLLSWFNTIAFSNDGAGNGDGIRNVDPVVGTHNDDPSAGFYTRLQGVLFFNGFPAASTINDVRGNEFYSGSPVHQVARCFFADPARVFGREPEKWNSTLQIFVGWNNPATRPIQHPDLHLPNIAGGAHDFVENQLSAPFPTSFQVDIDGQFRPIDDSASTNLHGPGSISDAGADEEG